MRFLACVAAIAIIVSAGVFHGDRSGRWGASAELARAVDRLEGVPLEVGSWRGESFELDAQQIEIGEIAGYVARRYEDRNRGAAVTVLLLCGRPGPVSAHTPEWCYGGAGYHSEGIPEVETVGSDPGGAAAFRTALFEKERSAVPEGLRIHWAWNAGRGWEAPENPRVAYAQDRVLYKLYVVRDASSEIGRPRSDTDVSLEFLRQFLPVVGEKLSPVAADET